MGRIAGMLEQAPKETTPLQRELDRVGKLLGVVVVVIAIVMIGTVLLIEDIHGIGAVFDVLIMGVALAVDVRTPTGSADQFLGSGATGIRPFIAISGRHRFSPHLNLGYEWNGESILAGNITGTTVGEDAAGSPTILNGPAVKRKLPAQLTYAVGADAGVTRALTLSFDYLGQALFDAPRAFLSSTITQNIAGGTGPLTLPTITGGRDTIGLSNGAVGVKYNLAGKLLLIGDILFRLDHKGLRQDVTPLIALSYEFGH